MSFVGVAYSNVAEGLLIGAEMTDRQLHHQAHHSIGTLEHTAQAAERLTGWRVPFLSDSVSLNIWQEGPKSSLQLVLAQSSIWGELSAFIAYPGREEPSESDKFQGFPELFWVVYLPAQGNSEIINKDIFS